ncbi:carbohydrate kinase [Fulvivirga sp. M361]|uniref:xylulokinase n=1 Tax=Fulvivirga sp. M361 TaxID=2594266 RepID=UPI001179B092|nr:FGGY family carbohydrate kinase [Fulvivirga sp. M361]TRX61205.1 carbohydrate kinase [Fulvivirga sp. M361]
MFYLGYDIGSSSVKAALIDADKNEMLSIVNYPKQEMPIDSPQKGWAEQNPEVWWENIVAATKLVLSETGVSSSDIKGIGIAYQMHGLVLVDKDQQVLRPSIIWCDSRAVNTGLDMLNAMGSDLAYDHLLNAPGNFTASKLKWVKDNEPHVFEKIHKVLLPGDFIALRMTGEFTTTIPGLSEGTFWDFKEKCISQDILRALGIDEEHFPTVVPTFSEQGKLSAQAAQQLSLSPGISIGYRAGDQPNNALALGVLENGELAATGGTSGVVYGISDRPVGDKNERVNSFAHVNHTNDATNIGVLLCINGAGSQYRWVKEMMASDGMGYEEMEEWSAAVPIGSEGLRIIPFGNGAERMLKNKNSGGQISNIQFNTHGKGHIFRASLEGIAFSFYYGIEILRYLGLNVAHLKVGNDNLFQSRVFSETLATLSGATIEMINTTGAVGAARGAAFGLGHFKTLREAVKEQETVGIYHPQDNNEPFISAYQDWRKYLKEFN